MDIKINFDQLFSSNGQTDLNTTHTTFEGPSIELSQQLVSSLNNSVQYKFSFNHKFFDNQDFDEAEIYFQAKDSEPEKASKNSKSIRIQEINQSYKSQQPGERLFYQSQLQQQRKMKQREKVQQQKQIQLNKSVTFVPTINQKSRKLAERQKHEPKQHKAKNVIKPTIQTIQQANQKQCTFHPKLIAKNKNQTKSKDELFYYLHNTAKIKSMKINKLAQEQYGQFSSNKKGSQEDVSNFLKRNEQYTSVVKKKQQILKNNSQKYDLKTGQKLFSPKIIENKAFNFHSTASYKQLKIQNAKESSNSSQNRQKKQLIYQQNDNFQKPKSGIFNKKYKTESAYDQYQQNSGQPPIQRSQHEIILQVEENSIVEHEKDHHKIKKLNIINPYQDDEIQGEQLNIWGSNEIKPFELSNANHYLNASEEETERKNNCVMEILNNLMIKQQEEN